MNFSIPELTDNQAKALHFIAAYQTRFSRMPTRREISWALGLSRLDPGEIIAGLERKGMITIVPAVTKRRGRNLEITERGSAWVKLVPIAKETLERLMRPRVAPPVQIELLPASTLSSSS